MKLTQVYCHVAAEILQSIYLNNLFSPTLESIGEKTEEDLNEDSPRTSTISTIEEDFRSMDCLDGAF